MPQVRVTVEEAILLNGIVCELSNHQGLLRNRGGLESALHRAETASYYEGLDHFGQAARLLEGVVIAHPFVDGNKRTALLVAVLFLRRHGVNLRDSKAALGKHILQFVVTEDSRFTSLEDLEIWLQYISQVVTGELAV